MARLAHLLGLLDAAATLMVLVMAASHHLPAKVGHDLNQLVVVAAVAAVLLGGAALVLAVVALRPQREPPWPI